MRIWNLRAIGCVVAALGLALPAAAVQVTLGSGRDNTLYSLRGDLSNGQGQHFLAGRAGAGGGFQTLRALLAFDIAAALPAGAEIESVSLTLAPTTPQFRSSGGVLALHRLQRDFGEGSSVASQGEGGGGTASLGDATWTHAVLDTDLWATPGGDYDSGALATAAADGVPVLSSALLVADVQRALDDPSQHFGWLLKLTDESLPAFRYGSFQSRSGNAPQLTIDYTVVPEPASASLLGLGLLALVARRSRPGGTP